MSDHVGEAEDAFVFTGESGRTVWRGTFNKLVKWSATVAAIGAPGLHFHDLRHTGNTLAAATGASTRELMRRMGHSSSRAALHYQHATQDREIAIARHLSGMIDEFGSQTG